MASTTTNKKTRTCLNAEGKIAVILFLDDFKVGDKLQKGAKKQACAKFNISHYTVNRIWELRGRIKLDEPSSMRLVLGNKKKGRVGPKKLTIDLDKVRSIPIEQRETIRSFAAAMGMALAPVWRHIKCGNLNRSPTVIKPVGSSMPSIT